MTVRAVFARAHRYAGLAIAGFLTIAGLTGSVIAFNHELDEWLNPELFRVDGPGPALAPLALAANVEAADRRVRVSSLPLRIEPGKSVSLWVEPRVDSATGKPFAVGYSQVFVDPSTGGILGTRLWGACCLERQHLIPFLYQLHYSLHVPAGVGLWLMGIVAMIWALDAFIGLYLTLPRGRPLFAKWRVAWRVKRGAGAYRLNFDLHRAAGLWLWGVLLMLAVSAVALNLNDQVFRPVVSLVSRVTPDVFDQREARPPGRPIEPRQPREHAIAVAVHEAKRRGWTLPVDAIYYASSFGIYSVGFGDHHAPGLGSPYVYVDGLDGRLVGARVPGEGTAGDLFLQLQFPLHSGQLAGLPGRIFIALTGLGVATLSVTGAVIWLRKRRARAAQPLPSPSPPAQPQTRAVPVLGPRTANQRRNR